jgi:hypothetical protein
MVAVLTISDYRNSENWNRARLAVCTILEFTESWSKRYEYRTLAKKIEHLSIGVLDNIAKGSDRSGDSNFLIQAANIIDALEKELSKVRHKRMLDDSDSALLKENLDVVKKSLKHPKT